MKGILFTPTMIKAIVGGTKFQTRRLDGLKEINKEPDRWELRKWEYPLTQKLSNEAGLFMRKDGTLKVIKPRYKVDEVVYIKEGIYCRNGYAWYSLDNEPVHFLQSLNPYFWRWKKDTLSPLFLPSDAARYFRQITDVRPERLQEITLVDAYAEGIDVVPSYYRIDVFKRLWDSINPKYPWAGNWWVWRNEFKLVKEK